MGNSAFFNILVALAFFHSVAADCNSLLQSYNTVNYQQPTCNILFNSEKDGEIDSKCQFNLVDEEPSKATEVLSTLVGHGYRLCFGCPNPLQGHCPNVAICSKDSKCYQRSAGNGVVEFGCCDTKCAACQGQCEGHLCNGDAYLQKLVNIYLKTISTSTTTTTTPLPATTVNYWSSWSSWSECFATNCPFDGVQVRSRVCLLASNACVGLDSESQTCHTPKCTTPATPNYWSDWTSWSQCFATDCSRQGFRVRTRTCQLGLGKCPGSDTQNNNCVASSCSSNGNTQTLTTAPPTVAPAATSTICADNDDAITNTCAYWTTYRICERGTASFQNIGSVYCRKTCGLCS